MSLAGQLGTILVVYYGMGIRLPLVALLAILGVGVVANLAATVWWRTGRAIGERSLAAMVGFDILFLTVQLFLTGGSFNPFNFLYLVHLALAAVVLTPGWTWGLFVLALACSAFLFYGEGALGLVPASAHSHADQIAMHLKGMWVAFAVAAVFIVHFVGRIRRSLADREADLAAQRGVAARNERLAALATLAAGAAHELATPLGTIAITAREIERQAERGQAASEEDARLIRAQVDRCRGILDHLATDAGAMSGEVSTRLSVRDLLDRAMADFRATPPVRIAGETGIEVLAPSRAVTQAIRAVIKNGYEANPGTAPSIEVQEVARQARVIVRDTGPGMDGETLARVGEPFFTTKTAGHGMGLGLFLATTVVEKLGGSLGVESWPGRGTRVTIGLPMASERCALDSTHNA